MGAKRAAKERDDRKKDQGRAPVDSAFLLDRSALPDQATLRGFTAPQASPPRAAATPRRRAPEHPAHSPRGATTARPAVRAQPLKSLGLKRLPHHWDEGQPEFDADELPFASWDDEDESGFDAPPLRSTGKAVAPRRGSSKHPAAGGTERGEILRQQAVALLGDDALATGLGRRARSAKVAVVKPETTVIRVPGGMRKGILRVAHATSVARKRPFLLLMLTFVIMITTALAGLTTAVKSTGISWGGAWHSLSGLIAFSGPPEPPPAPQSLDPQHYIDKYGFYKPASSAAITGDERDRLIFALPKIIRATSAFDARYHQKIEPQLVAFWSHSEGIHEHISYSNCANESAPNGYFGTIQNCDTPNFWQLGYGNQFSEIFVLKNAFTDLYGDPNNTALVQKVGQWVLDYDKQQGTTPACGGYSCTFPAMTIDSIMSGVDLRTGHATQNNWWASVLSRDPQINSYMIAEALQWFNHEATRRWVGNYYAPAPWQRISDRLGDILVSWPDLAAAAGVK